MDIINYQEIKKVKSAVGDTQELTTQNKINVVSAVNEINSKITSPLLLSFENDILNVDINEIRSFYMPFLSEGYIKGIRVTGNNDTGMFSLKLLTKENGNYVYDSGLVNNLLWDIMEDNPFIDETGDNKIYVILENKGIKCDFKLQIYVKVVK
jgi:hypothetical protein